MNYSRKKKIYKKRKFKHKKKKSRNYKGWQTC